jgi:hypothetical protein
MHGDSLVGEANDAEQLALEDEKPIDKTYGAVYLLDNDSETKTQKKDIN